MKIPRPSLDRPIRPSRAASRSARSSAAVPVGPRARRRVPAGRRIRRPALVALLAIAAGFALLAPSPPHATRDDVAAESIARAAACDTRLADGRAGWSACIAGLLEAMPAHPVAATAVHFHAWRVAEREARRGAADAAALRDAHGSRVRVALRDNTTSLHRLCAAAGEDCERVGAALDAST